MGWPAIPNAPRPDGVVNPVLDYDYGPAFRYNDSSGVITNVPPPIRGVIPTLVPKVDADGNEIAGVRSLLMRMPLGTYTGWNPIASAALEGPPAVARRRLRAVCEDKGGAPRRRRSAAVHRGAISRLWSYVSSAMTQADALVKQRFLLPEDAVRLLKQLLNDAEAGGLFGK